MYATQTLRDEHDGILAVAASTNSRHFLFILQGKYYLLSVPEPPVE